MKKNEKNVFLAEISKEEQVKLNGGESQPYNTGDEVQDIIKNSIIIINR